MTTRTGSPPLGRGAEWLDLGVPPVIVASGAEARRFCNGMFTNNLRDLPVGGVNRSAIVDDRGRIGGFLDALCEAEDRFVLILEGLDGPGFLERFEKYAMLDDVALDDVTGSRLLSVQGQVDLGPLGLAVPDPGRFVPGDPKIWRRIRSPSGGVDLLCSRDLPLDGVATAAGPERAELLRIAAGRPRFPQDTGDKRLPAEIGLRDELLSFDKGCYLGQESINRIDVMGEVKRRLVGVRLGGGPRTDAQVGVDGAAVGELTSAAVTPSGDVVGLAIVRRPHDEPGTAVVVGGQPGRVEAFPLELG